MHYRVMDIAIVAAAGSQNNAGAVARDSVVGDGRVITLGDGDVTSIAGTCSGPLELSVVNEGVVGNRGGVTDLVADTIQLTAGDGVAREQGAGGATVAQRPTPSLFEYVLLITRALMVPEILPPPSSIVSMTWA